MLKLVETDYREIARELEQYFYDLFYKPILEELKIEIANSRQSVINAIRTGEIVIKDGFIRGTFNAALSKELRKWGTFDKRTKAYRITGGIPADVKAASVIALAKQTELKSKIINKLNDLSINIKNGDIVKLKLSIGESYDKMGNRLAKDFKNIGIDQVLTMGQKEILEADYIGNQELNIKNWADDQIERLRVAVQEQSLKGMNIRELRKKIEKEYQVSKEKAKFLARQETSLFLSKYRRESSLSAGIDHYKWSTSKDERVRDRHEALQGQVFKYGEPPIVDDRGNRKEPGEDYNCRCVAIPVIYKSVLETGKAV